MPRSSFTAALTIGLLVSVPLASQAAVDIRVDLASQTMHVVSDGGDTHDWPVSTARRGFRTPRGTYGVQSLQRMHLSRKYHNSPMPYSIFFKGGYAIHGTFETASLGRAASHGCIRLSPDHATTLFRMVEAEGARITVEGAAHPRQALLADGERHERAHARHVAARQVDEDPLGYGPLRLAPSYDKWMRDPLGED